MSKLDLLIDQLPEGPTEIVRELRERTYNAREAERQRRQRDVDEWLRANPVQKVCDRLLEEARNVAGMRGDGATHSVHMSAEHIATHPDVLARWEAIQKAVEDYRFPKAEFKSGKNSDGWWFTIKVLWAVEELTNVEA